MNARRYSAWRFHYPFVTKLPEGPLALSHELDEASEQPGIKISPTGGIELISEKESVRQSLLLLLSTMPGERVMRPDYGCDLYRLEFAPNDNTTAGLAIHYVRQAVNRWEPRAQITRLDVAPNPEAPERLEILLEYRLRQTRDTDEIAFSVDLAGEQM